MSENRYTRRSFVKHSAMAAAAMAFINCNPFCKKSKGKRPNILFAIADDWGWPHARFYGDKVVKTPAFESIARNGILFNNAFVTAPSCTPSRNSILTGQYHWRLETGANLHSRFPDGPQTFPNILEDNGYFVGSCSKSFGPGADRERPVAGIKYDNFEIFLQTAPKDKPFCFWLGSKDPHRTYEWQSGVKSGMDPDDVQVPPCLPDTKEVRTDICDYYWEVQRFDKTVDDALELLEESGELDNTLIVMTGDNGWPFPRGKSNFYDLGVHVPLAVQWGNEIKKGRVIDDFVSLADFAPTFFEAAGLDVPEDVTAKSLISLFESNESGWIDPERDHVLTGKERHTLAQADSMSGTPMRAIRTKDFLYIHNFKPDRWPAGAPKNLYGRAFRDIDDSPTKSVILENKDRPEMKKYFKLCCGKRPADELYDLQKDPDQLTNVADDPTYKQDLKELKKRLFDELKQTKDPRVLGKGDVFDNYPYLGKKPVIK